MLDLNPFAPCRRSAGKCSTIRDAQIESNTQQLPLTFSKNHLLFSSVSSSSNLLVLSHVPPLLSSITDRLTSSLIHNLVPCRSAIRSTRPRTCNAPFLPKPYPPTQPPVCLLPRLGHLLNRDTWPRIHADGNCEATSSPAFLVSPAIGAAQAKRNAAACGRVFDLGTRAVLSRLRYHTRARSLPWSILYASRQWRVHGMR
ncbi:uncharacterized protein J3D65DRAFT_476017 [Phyllosticta citribraziliensis]|uniref:Uncharacterized protein n=1 Tax=Phyllosticta citribraziliensis TaxID=989973 RepID=A0ABR1LJT7_9PEZI